MTMKTTAQVAFEESVTDLIRDYIENNLRVRINKERGGYGSPSNSITFSVQLELDGEVFSDATEYFYEAEPERSW